MGRQAGGGFDAGPPDTPEWSHEVLIAYSRLFCFVGGLLGKNIRGAEEHGLGCIRRTDSPDY